MNLFVCIHTLYRCLDTSLLAVLFGNLVVPVVMVDNDHESSYNNNTSSNSSSNRAKQHEDMINIMLVCKYWKHVIDKEGRMISNNSNSSSNNNSNNSNNDSNTPSTINAVEEDEVL